MAFFEKYKDVIYVSLIALLFLTMAALGFTMIHTKPKPVCQVDLEKVVESAVLSYTMDGNETDIKTADTILKSLRTNIDAEKFGCSAIFVRGAVLSVGDGKDITNDVLDSVKKK